MVRLPLLLFFDFYSWRSLALYPLFLFYQHINLIFVGVYSVSAVWCVHKMSESLSLFVPYVSVSHYFSFFVYGFMSGVSKYLLIGTANLLYSVWCMQLARYRSSVSFNFNLMFFSKIFFLQFSISSELLLLLLLVRSLIRISPKAIYIYRLGRGILNQVRSLCV